MFGFSSPAALSTAEAARRPALRLPWILRTAVLAVGLFFIGQALTLMQETPVHSVVYATLARAFEPAGLALARPSREVAFVRQPSPAELRDMAFEWYAIRPEAQEWMQQLPISYEASSVWGGRYEMDLHSVTVSQPYLHIVLHEYAHANLHHKSTWEKAETLAGVMRLLVDPDPRNAQAQQVLRGVLADGARAMQQGRAYGLLHEAYAYLAQWSGGDLAALPDYLQPAYTDYLQPGQNRWLSWQAQQAQRASVRSALTR